MVRILLIVLIGLTGCTVQSDYTINQRNAKEYALCECISEGLRREGIKNFDYSAGHIMNTSMIDYDVYRKIDSVIEKLYNNSNVDIRTEMGPAKGYNYRCLKLYESYYLDSLVKSKYEIMKMNNEDERTYINKFNKDSIYFEEMIRNSQLEKVE